MPFENKSLKLFASPSWSKLGSMCQSATGVAQRVRVAFKARSEVCFAIYEMKAGVIHHEHLELIKTDKDQGRTKRLLGNMHIFSPEAHFFNKEAEAIPVPSLDTLKESEAFEVTLKSCNRCARMLPINTGGDEERNHLSFTNHCVAERRRPCSHTGFGKLKNIQTKETVRLEYGFQLECRFCKKFEVNAKHNPQRTAAQMKEDGARRRAFELLMERLLEGAPQLKYRQQHTSELTDDVFKRFSGKCFKCRGKFRLPRNMHLDHTRPLALLWPLDRTATALCKNCNSAKRDRPPSEYYSSAELTRLAEITQLSIDDLRDPGPNIRVLDLLKKRLDWFFDEFLSSAEMTKKRDEKITGELLVKAIDKADSKRSGGAQLDLLGKYNERRGKAGVAVAHQAGGGKLPGKTKYSGRRRKMTRKSGHHAHPDSTGGEIEIAPVPSYLLAKGATQEFTFDIAPHQAGDFIGYGGWFRFSGDLEVTVNVEEQAIDAV